MLRQIAVVLTKSCILGNDWRHAASTISEGRVNGKLALLANSHAEKTLIPALNDLSLANGEIQWAVALIGLVELRAVGQRALVVDEDVVAWVAG